jgi:hypothetical protein
MRRADTEQRDRKHAEVRALVERIRRETGRRVPDIDPGGPGMQARVLFVFRVPNERGSLLTGVMSPDNPDPAAKYQSELMADVGLSESICVGWNAIPWDIGRASILRAQRLQGASYLLDLLRLFDHAPVVVANGGEAQAVCRIAKIAAIEVPMPSPRGWYGGGANRRPVAVAGLRRAAELAARSWPDTRV